MKLTECLTKVFCCGCCDKPTPPSPKRKQLRRSAPIEMQIDEIARGHMPKQSGHVWGVKDGLEEQHGNN